MKNKNARNSSILSSEGQATIQTMAEKLGKQISELLADSMGEILLLAKERSQMTIQPTFQQEMTLPQSDEFLRAIDVAGILKISKASAYQLIRTKEIPSISFGRTVRVRWVDLDTFIQAHRVQ